MARGKRKRGNGESIGGFFRPILEKNPQLLKGRSNAELIKMWEEAHPGERADQRIKQNLSNVKSLMRSKKRKQARKAKKAQLAAGKLAPVAATTRPIRNLETLEERIDDCLILAKNLDRDGLESVIKHLLVARREVVWKMGE